MVAGAVATGRSARLDDLDALEGLARQREGQEAVGARVKARLAAQIPPGRRITYGHSKARRPDLKQLLYELTALGPNSPLRPLLTRPRAG